MGSVIEEVAGRVLPTLLDRGTLDGVQTSAAHATPARDVCAVAKWRQRARARDAWLYVAPATHMAFWMHARTREAQTKKK